MARTKVRNGKYKEINHALNYGSKKVKKRKKKPKQYEFKRRPVVLERQLYQLQTKYENSLKLINELQGLDQKPEVKIENWSESLEWKIEKREEKIEDTEICAMNNESMNQDENLLGKWKTKKEDGSCSKDQKQLRYELTRQPVIDEEQHGNVKLEQEQVDVLDDCGEHCEREYEQLKNKSFDLQKKYQKNLKLIDEKKYNENLEKI